MMLTVIIPTKERVFSLNRAIKSATQISVVKQIIVVNDSSNEIEFKNFDEDLRSNTKVIWMKNYLNPGAVGARISGLLNSNTDVVIFLDSDDILFSHGVEQLYREILKDQEIGICYSNLLVDNKQKTNFLRLEGYQFKRVVQNLSLAPFTGLMIRKKFFNIFDIDLSLKAWQDDDFVLSIARKSKVKFVDVVSGSMMTNEKNRITNDCNRIYEGLYLLITKWSTEITENLGLHYYYLWKLRLIIIKYICRGKKMQQKTNFLYRALGTIIIIFAKTTRKFLKIYFDRIYF